MRVSQWLRPHAARCQNELDRPESALSSERVNSSSRDDEDPAALLDIRVVILLSVIVSTVCLQVKIVS